MFIRDFFKVIYPLYSPDDGGGIGVISDLEALEDKDEEKEEKVEDDDKEDDGEGEVKEEDEDEGEEGKDEDKDEKDKDEDEEEGEGEDKQLLTTWTDIKKKYPNFNKDFPDVKSAIFRDQQYSSIFSSPKDAEEVVGKAEVLDNLGNDLLVLGDPTTLLDTIGKQNPESLKKVALKILPYFQEKDKDFYYEMAAVPIKQLLRSAHAEGKGRETDLGRAALYLHNYFFNNLDIDKPVKGESKVSDEKSAKEKQLEDKLESINKKEEDAFITSIDDSYISKMTRQIREGLDKDERLTEWMKTKVTEDTLREIKKQLSADTRHSTQMQSLYKQAKSSGFANDFKSRLVNTALVRAKSLVPTIRQKLVSEALGKVKKITSPNEKVVKEVVSSSYRPQKEKKDNSSKGPKTDLDILRG